MRNQSLSQRAQTSRARRVVEPLAVPLAARSVQRALEEQDDEREKPDRGTTPEEEPQCWRGAAHDVRHTRTLAAGLTRKGGEATGTGRRTRARNHGNCGYHRCMSAPRRRTTAWAPARPRRSPPPPPTEAPPAAARAPARRRRPAHGRPPSRAAPGSTRSAPRATCRRCTRCGSARTRSSTRPTARCSARSRPSATGRWYRCRG